MTTDLRERIEAVLSEHTSDGRYARWGGDALLHDIREALRVPRDPSIADPTDHYEENPA